MATNNYWDYSLDPTTGKIALGPYAGKTMEEAREAYAADQKAKKQQEFNSIVTNSQYNGMKDILNYAAAPLSMASAATAEGINGLTGQGGGAQWGRIGNAQAQRDLSDTFLGAGIYDKDGYKRATGTGGMLRNGLLMMIDPGELLTGAAAIGKVDDVARLATKAIPEAKRMIRSGINPAHMEGITTNGFSLSSLNPLAKYKNNKLLAKLSAEFNALPHTGVDRYEYYKNLPPELQEKFYEYRKNAIDEGKKFYDKTIKSQESEARSKAEYEEYDRIQAEKIRLKQERYEKLIAEKKAEEDAKEAAMLAQKEEGVEDIKNRHPLYKGLSNLGISAEDLYDAGYTGLDLNSEILPKGSVDKRYVTRLPKPEIFEATKKFSQSNPLAIARDKSLAHNNSVRYILSRDGKSHLFDFSPEGEKKLYDGLASGKTAGIQGGRGNKYLENNYVSSAGHSLPLTSLDDPMVKKNNKYGNIENTDIINGTRFVDESFSRPKNDIRSKYVDKDGYIVEGSPQHEALLRDYPNANWQGLVKTNTLSRDANILNFESSEKIKDIKNNLNRLVRNSGHGDISPEIMGQILTDGGFDGSSHVDMVKELQILPNSTAIDFDIKKLFSLMGIGLGLNQFNDDK